MSDSCGGGVGGWEGTHAADKPQLKQLFAQLDRKRIYILFSRYSALIKAPQTGTRDAKKKEKNKGGARRLLTGVGGSSPRRNLWL